LLFWEGGVLGFKTLNGLQIFSCFLRFAGKNIFFIRYPIKKRENKQPIVLLRLQDQKHWTQIMQYAAENNFAA